MKKRIIKFLIVLLIYIALPVKVNANANDDLTINNWIVNAKLLENGDLEISEDLNFNFNDSFNGVYRELLLDKTSGIKNIKVGELNNGYLKSYNKVAKAENGDTNVFIINEEKNKVEIKIFSPSKNEDKIFRIEYIVKDVAIKYNDTGELYYKFIGEENTTAIKNLTINITLPGQDERVKVFAHGPLNGRISSNNNIYTLSVKNVPDKTFIECRVLFPREFIQNSNNIINIDNLNNIIMEEEAYQNELIEKQKQREKLNEIFGIISLVMSSIGLGIIVIFGLMFKRNINSNILNAAKIPEDCTPAVAAYLISSHLGANVIFATILDLYRKEHLLIKSENEKIEIEKIDEDQNFIITKKENDEDSLLAHERYFKDVLFNKIGNGKSVSTNDIKKYRENKQTEFIDLFFSWKNEVKEVAVSKGYYDKSKIKYGFVFLIFSFIQFVFSLITLTYENLFGTISLVLSVMVFVFSLSLFVRLSDYGLKQYKKWIIFKNFHKNKKIASVDYYLNYSIELSIIYALALGIDNKFKDDLNNDNMYSHNWIIWYVLFMNNSTFKETFSNSLSGGSIDNVGGFSTGGGSGAGGGGAGGF